MRNRRRLLAMALPASFILVACTRDRPNLGGRSDTLGTDAAGATRAAAPAFPPGELAYVTNEDSRELTVISTTNDSVVATIPVGTRPRGVKVSPDGRFVYVALSGSPKCPPTMPDEECDKLIPDKSKDGIAEVDVAQRKVVRVLPGGSDPEQFDIGSDGTRLYIANEDAGEASIIDIKSGTVDTTVSVGKEPEGVRVSPDGRRVYVTAESNHAIYVLDAATGRREAVIEVDQRPRDVAFTADGRRAYSTAEMGGTVSVIDVAANRVLKTIKLGGEAKPMGVRVSPDGKRVYVTTGRGGTVEVIDVATNKVTASIKVGQRPWGLALTSDGRKLYTANGPSNDVSVVDTETLRVIATIPVGKVPWGVAIAPSPGQEGTH